MAYFNFLQSRSAKQLGRGNFNFKPPNNKKQRLFFSWLGLTIFLFFLIMVVAPSLGPQWREIKSSTKTAAVVQSIVGEENSTQSGFGGIPKESNPVNFLLLGAAGEGYEAPDLTDTILVARLIPDQSKVYLFSLPRDLLVKIPKSEDWAKLNTLYALAKKNKGREFDLIKQKVEIITGLSVAYCVLVDLNTVKDLVDTLGGVNVMVKKDIIDTAFPGPNHSYQTFVLGAGWRYLDGETALKYIRSRHSALGDFDRIARQQEVLQALKQKVLSLSFWDLPTFFNIFNTVSSKIKTDLSLWQVKDFWDKIKNIPGQNIVKTEIDSPELMITGQTDLGGQTVSIVQPRAGLENYNEIKNYIEKIISQ